MRQEHITVQYQKRTQHQKANDYFHQLTERLDNEIDVNIKPIIQSAIESTNLDNSNNNEVTYD